MSTVNTSGEGESGMSIELRGLIAWSPGHCWGIARMAGNGHLNAYLLWKEALVYDWAKGLLRGIFDNVITKDDYCVDGFEECIAKWMRTFDIVVVYLDPDQERGTVEFEFVSLERGKVGSYTAEFYVPALRWDLEHPYGDEDEDEDDYEDDSQTQDV